MFAPSLRSHVEAQWSSPLPRPAQGFSSPSAAANELESFQTKLAGFAPITLSQMNSVALLDRVESKYLLTTPMLLDGLESLRDFYTVLEVEGQRLNRYRTLYFDTDDFALYMRHHAGARDRYKVRSREYVESHCTFLEVKHKTNRRRTVKSRVATQEMVTALSGEPAHFVSDACPYGADQLAPRLWNNYHRVTLVNGRGGERLTLDLGLTFTWEGQTVSLPGLVIAEVKQQGRRADSPFTLWTAGRRLRPTGFSKYCMGASLLYPELKANRFKASYRHLARLLQGVPNVYH